MRVSHPACDSPPDFPLPNRRRITVCIVNGVNSGVEIAHSDAETGLTCLKSTEQIIKKRKINLGPFHGVNWPVGGGYEELEIEFDV